MSLTELQCRSAKPKDKAYRLHDANYLYLEVTPSGSKLWRMRCKTKSKITTKALGKYPAVSLKDARIKRDELLTSIHETGDLPTPEKKSNNTTFEVIADAWLSTEKPGWSASHYEKTCTRLNKYLIPSLGKLDISDIDPEAVFNAVKIPIEKQKHETAKRVRGIASQIFDFAFVLGKIKINPARGIQILMPKIKTKNFAFLDEPKKIGAFLLAMDAYDGQDYVRIGLQLLPLFFVRPGNLRLAEWDEIDFKNRLWRIPAEKMKGRQEHLVPLADQSITLLLKLKELTGTGRYLFPSVLSRNRAISDNTFITAYKRCGYTSDDIVPHGCRHMASTMLHDMGERTEVIEKQMAHSDRNKIRAIYNKAEYLPERTALMQRWADRLDEFRALVKPLIK